MSYYRRSPSSTQVTIPANFLNQNHRRNISKSVTISRTESRTRWVRSAPATVSTSPNARRTPEDSDEVRKILNHLKGRGRLCFAKGTSIGKT